MHEINHHKPWSVAREPAELRSAKMIHFHSLCHRIPNTVSLTGKCTLEPWSIFAYLHSPARGKVETYPTFSEPRHGKPPRLEGFAFFLGSTQRTVIMHNWQDSGVEGLANERYPHGADVSLCDIPALRHTRAQTAHGNARAAFHLKCRI